jgi:hypothetical protein
MNSWDWARVSARLSLGISAALMVAAAPAFAQRVQSIGSSCASSTSCTATFARNVTAGDAVAVAVMVGPGTATPENPVIADSQGNSYSLVASNSSTFVFCTPKITSGTDSVSSELAAAQVQSMSAMEFQGGCAVDQMATAGGSSTSAKPSGISARAGDFVLAVATTPTANTFQVSSGYSPAHGTTTVATADLVQATDGTASVSFTLGQSSSWTAFLIALSPTPPSNPTFDITATLQWDDGTPVTGSVTIAQESAPNATNSLGSFQLSSSGIAQGTVTPNLALPLTFFISLFNTSGTAVSSLPVFTSMRIIEALPRTLNPSIVLMKSNGSVKSVSF